MFDGNTCNPIRSIDLCGFKPVEIYCSTEGFILLTTMQSQILILNQDGDIVKKFGLSRDDDGQVACPISMCTNSKGEIIIVDAFIKYRFSLAMEYFYVQYYVVEEIRTK